MRILFLLTFNRNKACNNGRPITSGEVKAGLNMQIRLVPLETAARPEKLQNVRMEHSTRRKREPNLTALEKVCVIFAHYILTYLLLF